MQFISFNLYISPSLITLLRDVKNSVIQGFIPASLANHYCPSLQNSIMQQEVREIWISLHVYQVPG
ncbi:unnamed protein product [Brassica rapa subsp. trilocularis]